MEEKNRKGGLKLARGLAGDGDRVVLLSVGEECSTRSVLLPSDVCFLRSETKNSRTVTSRH